MRFDRPFSKRCGKEHDTRAAFERFMRMARKNRAVIDRLTVIAAELETLMPPDFLSCLSDQRMRLLPRYLRALGIRAERAYVSPEKDRAKEAGLNHIGLNSVRSENGFFPGPRKRGSIL